MRLFALTELGRRAAQTGGSKSDEMRVLQYLYENRTATDETLEHVVDGAGSICRSLKRRNLVRELTS